MSKVVPVAFCVLGSPAGSQAAAHCVSEPPRGGRR